MNDTTQTKTEAFDQATFEADGQKAIVALAESVLEQARAGEFTALLITGVHKNGNIGTVWSSTTGGFLWLLGMCEVAKARIFSFMTPPQEPPPPPPEETIN